MAPGTTRAKLSPTAASTCWTSTHPNFKRSVIARQVLTPLDLERVFNLTGGNIFQGAMTPGQLFAFRPVPGYAALPDAGPGPVPVRRCRPPRRRRDGHARPQRRPRDLGSAPLPCTRQPAREEPPRACLNQRSGHDRAQRFRAIPPLGAGLCHGQPAPAAAIASPSRVCAFSRLRSSRSCRSKSSWSVTAGAGVVMVSPFSCVPLSPGTRPSAKRGARRVDPSAFGRAGSRSTARRTDRAPPPCTCGRRSRSRARRRSSSDFRASRP